MGCSSSSSGRCAVFVVHLREHHSPPSVLGGTRISSKLVRILMRRRVEECVRAKVSGHAAEHSEPDRVHVEESGLARCRTSRCVNVCPHSLRVCLSVFEPALATLRSPPSLEDRIDESFAYDADCGADEQKGHIPHTMRVCAVAVRSADACPTRRRRSPGSSTAASSPTSGSPGRFTSEEIECCCNTRTRSSAPARHRRAQLSCGEAFDVHDLVPRGLSPHDGHAPRGHPGASRDEAAQRRVRGAVDRWRREANEQTAAAFAPDLVASRSRDNAHLDLSHAGSVGRSAMRQHQRDRAATGLLVVRHTASRSLDRSGTEPATCCP